MTDEEVKMYVLNYNVIRITKKVHGEVIMEFFVKNVII